MRTGLRGAPNPNLIGSVGIADAPRHALHEHASRPKPTPKTLGFPRTYADPLRVDERRTSHSSTSLLAAPQRSREPDAATTNASCAQRG